MSPKRQSKRSPGKQPAVVHSLPTPQGSPEKPSSEQEQPSSTHGKHSVTVVGNPSPIIVTKMAKGIIVEDLQDDLLSDCYSDLNPRRLQGMLLDGQDSQIQGTMLTHIMDKFEAKTNEKLLLRMLKTWFTFQGRVPYANLAQIDMRFIYPDGRTGSRHESFLKFWSPNIEPTTMKAITVGVAEYCHLVSAEKVSINPPKSMKKIKFRMFAQELALTSGALCDGFNRTLLVANAWKDVFSASTKFGKQEYIDIVTDRSDRKLADCPFANNFIPIYDARGREFHPEDLDEKGPTKLPLLKDGDKMVEVPAGSIVLICHTVFRRVQEGKHMVNFNVHWVVVLAIPDDPMGGNNMVSFESDSELEVDGNY
ncbi:hypothetical protein GYMLUDRAFT_265303 [Collybiopsis luxurians FD-317 M1]|uniref:Uncharacterized protein n=1 Tax=Collybiopsis luxurians FD-317 M1 TaxID=944289 RepID=A0A0D0C4J8_9AGAR|nr:hypothetical protein GYMLUDRAFT_265303 [Collybiopsis luxurians FD-317 M1]